MHGFPCNIYGFPYNRRSADRQAEINGIPTFFIVRDRAGGVISRRSNYLRVRSFYEDFPCCTSVSRSTRPFCCSTRVSSQQNTAQTRPAVQPASTSVG